MWRESECSLSERDNSSWGRHTSPLPATGLFWPWWWLKDGWRGKREPLTHWHSSARVEAQCQNVFSGEERGGGGEIVDTGKFFYWRLLAIEITWNLRKHPPPCRSATYAGQSIIIVLESNTSWSLFGSELCRRGSPAPGITQSTPLPSQPWQTVGSKFMGLWALLFQSFRCPLFCRFLALSTYACST